MKTMSIAIKNLKKSFSFYALYLLSVSLVITVFFAFTSFSMNEVMLEKISENGRVETIQCFTPDFYYITKFIYRLVLEK